MGETIGVQIDQSQCYVVADEQLCMLNIRAVLGNGNYRIYLF